MITDELATKLLTPRTLTPNVVSLDDLGELADGAKSLAVAGEDLRAWTQNLIDLIADHYPLREARVLVVIEHSAATGDQLRDPKSREPVRIGKAQRANPMVKLLTQPPPPPAPPQGDNTPEPSASDPVVELFGRCADFVLRLSGDWLDMRLDEEAGPDALAQGRRAVLALIDHELMHCSAKVAGKLYPSVDQARLQAGGHGKDFLEVVEVAQPDGQGPAGLLLWYHRGDDGRLRFKIRRHDLEEFQSIIRRHGAWKMDVEQFCDVLIEEGRDTPAAEDAETQRPRGRKERRAS